MELNSSLSNIIFSPTVNVCIAHKDKSPEFQVNAEMQSTMNGTLLDDLARSLHEMRSNQNNVNEQMERRLSEVIKHQEGRINEMNQRHEERLGESQHVVGDLQNTLLQAIKESQPTTAQVTAPVQQTIPPTQVTNYVDSTRPPIQSQHGVPRFQTNRLPNNNHMPHA